MGNFCTSRMTYKQRRNHESVETVLIKNEIRRTRDDVRKGTKKEKDIKNLENKLDKQYKKNRDMSEREHKK